MRLANFVIVFLAFDLFELTRDRLGLIDVSCWVLPLVLFSEQLLLELFPFVREHLQKGLDKLGVIDLLHALEVKDSWRGVLLING